MTLSERASQIRDRVRVAAEQADRDPSDVTIIAVSKTFPRGDVDAAYAEGFRDFGESRVQEIREKFSTPLPDNARLHMIGSLQSNKVKQVLPFVSMIHTVDRPSLLDAVSKALVSTTWDMSCLVEVNVAGESQKAGCQPAQAQSILDRISEIPGLTCRGLMTMAPLTDDPASVRPVFRELRELRDRLQDASGSALPVLSMGMSNDFESAIAEGATHVRIGRALFGSRE